MRLDRKRKLNLLILKAIINYKIVMSKFVWLRYKSVRSIAILICIMIIPSFIFTSNNKDFFLNNDKNSNVINMSMGFIKVNNIQTEIVPNSVYIGNSSTVNKVLIANDVRCFDMEQYNNTIYILYATYNNENPEIFMVKYWLSNHSFSNPWPVGQYNTVDHFQVSQAIDADGYIHLVWSTKKNYETYVRSQYPEDITNWTTEQLFCDSDSTYNEIYCYGDTIYNFFRDGLHGYGWKLTWKKRNETNWQQRKIISGTGKDFMHPYMYTEGSWLFENPNEQYFTYYWTEDNLTEFRYQRITHYNFSTGKHYHLNGSIIRYLDGSTVPHEGPFEYYGQCGDFISDNFQNKTPGSEKGRLVISVEKTNENIVVMSNIGENPAAGFPPRTLQCSIWNGSSWAYRTLNFSTKEDFGALRIGRCKGANGESLWLVPRKPFNGSEHYSHTDLSIIRCRNGGKDISYENFTNDNLVWVGESEALYNPEAEEYVIGWLQNTGDKGNGNEFYIGYKSFKPPSSLPIITINYPKSKQSFNSTAPYFNIEVIDPDGIGRMWYTLDGGLTNITFMNNGTIDQGMWETLSDGRVKIIFYANDSLGNINHKSISIFKDTQYPIIIINNPQPNDLFSVTAPNFNIIIKDLTLHTTWYTIDGGLTNITFTDNGTIDQVSWMLLPDGNVNLMFFANDSLGNIFSKSVVILKDTQPPNIIINEPQNYDTFGVAAPKFNITIDELTLHTTWYTIDRGVTNITFTATVFTIPQSLWDALNEGEILIGFYANDSVGYHTYLEVIIRKDTTSPILTIISPISGQIFKNRAPFFNITIEETNLGHVWYTIDGGIINTTISDMTGFVDRDLWSNSPDGFVTITFYVKDLAGNLAFAEVSVQKSTSLDSVGVTIIYPLNILLASICIATLIIIRKKIKIKQF